MTARQTLTPVCQTVLATLVAILDVSKIPSNPCFDQFIFEGFLGLSGTFLIFALQPLTVHRFVMARMPTTLATFEQALFGPFTIILQ
ncbi:hypothetical protein BD779DRAFT_1455016 [Infundibulicybe gibba]|nr:hypothetical protein BD779DRAFT_1455011 [Infundibulicybe gibba]KAF8870601.1 hypothetical protein BD779DRAFT_1455016 [Infundibulicybe gibba]